MQLNLQIFLQHYTIQLASHSHSLFHDYKKKIFPIYTNSKSILSNNDRQIAKSQKIYISNLRFNSRTASKCGFSLFRTTIQTRRWNVSLKKCEEVVVHLLQVLELSNQ
ncbi:hypothetical protein AAHA92_06352 [Salvia divinorum]|uniref:Uncharacterized protein n=1 Tax=Salvia divinorum TaxID=28513 RepID=A0ABD1I5D9_SALDI